MSILNNHFRKIIIYLLLIISLSDNSGAQCPATKYGIVPVWPVNWTYTDKENWYQMMHDKGMGYFHSIYTWQDLEQIQNNGLLSAVIDYFIHIKEDYEFKHHLLIRNPAITFNAVPPDYLGMTYSDTAMTNAFYDFCIETVDSFAMVLDYLTIGGEADGYFAVYPEQLHDYVNVLSDVADYVHTNYPSIKFATTLTFLHGVMENDTLWQLTKDFSDMLSVTYWPLEPDFMVMPSAVTGIEGHISDLIAAADDKPVIIKESGLPSATLLNSSEAMQEQFAAELFYQTMNEDQIEIVGWDFLADFDSITLDQLVIQHQIYTPEFRAYIGTLGLMDTTGNPKPAYNTYLQIMDSLCNSLSIEQNEENTGEDIFFYPNPANSRFMIETVKDCRVKMFDCHGRLVLEEKDTRIIDITHLTDGIYFLRIESYDRVQIKKIIKSCIY